MSETWYAPFSPLIMRVRLPEPLRLALVDATTALLADDALCAEHAEQSPVLYDVSRRVELPEALLAGLPEVMEHLHEVCTHYARQVYARMGAHEFSGGIDPAACRAFLSVMWVNSALKGDFIPAHKHSSDFSGAVYLKIPEGMGGDSGMGGQLTFSDGRPHQLVREKISFTPEEGDVFIFPGWLSHAVHPFRCEGERRMISLNGFIAFPPPEGMEEDGLPPEA